MFLIMKNPRITEEEIGLIKKAQEGNELAFNTLYRRYKPFVENVLFHYIKDMDEAKDIANIVFLKVYDKLSTFTAYDSFGGWLRIIANRTAIDYLRETQNKRIVLGEEGERLSLDSIHNTAETDLVNHVTYGELLTEFEKLDEDTRRIFELFYVEDLPIKDISKIMNVTIKSTLSRTRRKIKKSIKS